MKTMFEDLMTSLDEVESYLAGNREGYKVHVPADVQAADTDQVTASIEWRAVKLGALVWPQYTDWQSLRDTGALVDRLGFESLWTWDHVYPIVGDPVYGRSGVHMMLHAASLSVPRPGKEAVAAKAPLPAHFLAAGWTDGEA